MLESWPIEIDTSIEIPLGVSIMVLRFTANSILVRYWKSRNHETLRERFMEINQQLCKPVGEYVEAIWDDAMDYIRRQESA